MRRKTPLETATVKRSVTIGREIDEAIQRTVGAGRYSAFINEAAVLALQSQGVRDWLEEFEAERGAITPQERRAARARRAEAATGARRRKAAAKTLR